MFNPVSVVVVVAGSVDSKILTPLLTDTLAVVERQTS